MSVATISVEKKWIKGKVYDIFLYKYMLFINKSAVYNNNICCNTTHLLSSVVFFVASLNKKST